MRDTKTRVSLPRKAQIRGIEECPADEIVKWKYGNFFLNKWKYGTLLLKSEESPYFNISVFNVLFCSLNSLPLSSQSALLQTLTPTLPPPFFSISPSTFLCLSIRFVDSSSSPIHPFVQVKCFQAQLLWILHPMWSQFIQER
ncbi:hypothetical protein P8452_38446 [Trifolium repens]|nr:hypothetical protein P8452_38446 [Trifolium repens]